MICPKMQLKKEGIRMIRRKLEELAIYELQEESNVIEVSLLRICLWKKLIRV